jgi:hypothetical protein
MGTLLTNKGLYQKTSSLSIARVSDIMKNISANTFARIYE